eukprot:TRINITY_DN2404_c0_g1_i1.p1 TRINITY_DN2404_c0_g1~~TRINITY_DN2404_c0_g1_i1.p1  ORF type:complete len:343 (-),score=92.84 TRINITY_DN2404_c0_g1_i1:259-1287(-)
MGRASSLLALAWALPDACHALVVARGVCAFRGATVGVPEALHTQRRAPMYMAHASLQRATAGILAGFLIGSHAALAASLPSSSLVDEVQNLNEKVQIEGKLMEEGIKQQKQARSRSPDKIPFVEKKEDFNMVPVRDNQLETAVAKIQALNPYLEEVEYLITSKNWGYLQGFLGVFSEQEENFVDLIDGLYPTESPADKSSREAMQYEAQNVFLALDDLNTASRYKRAKAAEKSFVKLALAYDRFLKAGGLVQTYDPITSTEPFYSSIPDSALVYDTTKPPELKDNILILKGPDKGRTGRLIGVIKSRQEAIVRMDHNKEVKLLSLGDIAKQLDTPPPAPAKS